jgi:pimeloyl-ACP methyl ester carboxylesterase
MVDVVGSLDEPILFFLHGTPGSRRISPAYAAVGEKKRVCHVSYSRPGYEGSDRDPGRTVFDCAGDIAAIADALGIEAFHVFGESGGGAHALAVAASLGERVRGVALMSTSGPYNVPGFDWAEGMAREIIEEDTVALAGEGPLRVHLEGEFEKLRAVETSAQLLEVLGGITSPADRDTYENELAEHGLFVWREAARTGFWGWLDDDLAMVGDWGFQLDRVGAKVAVWHGDADLTVPLAHGEWLADHLPRAEFVALPGVGHNSIVNHYGAILDGLLSAGT